MEKWGQKPSDTSPFKTSLKTQREGEGRREREKEREREGTPRTYSIGAFRFLYHRFILGGTHTQHTRCRVLLTPTKDGGTEGARGFTAGGGASVASDDVTRPPPP